MDHCTCLCVYQIKYDILKHHSQDCHLGQLYLQDQSHPLYPEEDGQEKHFRHVPLIHINKFRLEEMMAKFAEYSDMY